MKETVGGKKESQIWQIRKILLEFWKYLNFTKKRRIKKTFYYLFPGDFYGLIKLFLTVRSCWTDFLHISTELNKYSQTWDKSLHHIMHNGYFPYILIPTIYNTILSIQSVKTKRNKCLDKCLHWKRYGLNIKGAFAFFKTRKAIT